MNISLHDLPLSVEEYTVPNKIPEGLQLKNKVDCNTLFHIRRIRFLCGSVALGISLNHQVGDAHSYFQLIKDWTELYKNLEYQPNVCHQRSLLEPTLTEIQTLKTSNPDFNKRDNFYIKEEKQELPSSKQPIIKIFRFSADELNRMKSDATTHLPLHTPYISTFEVLSAHLSRLVMLARNLPTSSITRLYISTNLRPRSTHPLIPLTYFGNALMLPFVELISSDLINENNLSLFSSQIHHTLEKITNHSIRTTLAWIMCQDDKTRITPTWNLNETDLTITAWNKMGMYSNSNFESDVYPYRIILPQDTKFNGAATLFSTEMNDGSMDVYLGLDMNEMERLENNAEFRKYRV